MTHDEAVAVLRKLLFAIQRWRSMSEEELANRHPDTKSEVRKAVLDDLFKWLNDDQYTLVRPLTMMLDRVDEGGRISAMEFYNICYVMHRFQPEVLAALEIMYEFDLPKPSLDFFKVM